MSYFREAHKSQYNVNKDPKKGDMVLYLAGKYRTEARWRKAVQHLLERGELTSSPKDIGNLLKEVNQDLERECADEIKDYLLEQVRKELFRRVVHGLPEWYKGELLKEQFGVKEEESETGQTSDGSGENEDLEGACGETGHAAAGQAATGQEATG